MKMKIEDGIWKIGSKIKIKIKIKLKMKEATGCRLQTTGKARSLSGPC